MLKFIKDWMLMIAMLTGALSYKLTEHIAFLTPYLIFTMLLLSFSRLSPRSIRFNRLHVILLVIQLAGSAAVYGLLSLWDPVIAQGAMICVLISTATSAVVITGMLGGDMAFLTSYTLLSSLAVALFAPLFFSVAGVQGDMSFVDSFLMVCRRVGPLLILPLLLAWAVRYLFPKVNRALTGAGWLSFYLWATALAIVTGNTVRFLVGSGMADRSAEITLAAAALLICVGQFTLGRYLGRRYNNDAVSAGQGLGQKNTVLAIWLAHIYLNPVASVAPASYVVWQNIINSWQIWKKRNGK